MQSAQMNLMDQAYRSPAFENCANSLFCDKDLGALQLILPVRATYGTNLPTIQTQSLKVENGVLQIQDGPCLVLFLRYLLNSKSGLGCTRSMFLRITEELCVHPRFKDFVTCFRRKDHENEYAHPACVFRSLDVNSSAQSNGHECIYGIRYPGIRGGPNGASDPLRKWSIRPLVIHHKIDPNQPKDTWIFVGIPPQSEFETFETLIHEHLRDGSTSTECNWALHLALLQHCILKWKTYLEALQHLSKEQAQEFLFVKPGDLENFQRRQKLKRLEDSLLALPIIFRSLRGTIKCLMAKSNGFYNISSSFITFEELLEENELLLKRVEILEKQVKSISAITWDYSVHHNSHAMMEIAKDTKRDSAAMKIITIITVLFLPATFVATFFSMQFVDVSDDVFHISHRIWIYVAVTIPLTIFTIVVWIIGMSVKSKHVQRWLPKGLRKDFLDKNDGSTDIEEGP